MHGAEHSPYRGPWDTDRTAPGVTAQHPLKPGDSQNSESAWKRWLRANLRVFVLLQVLSTVVFAIFAFALMIARRG